MGRELLDSQLRTFSELLQKNYLINLQNGDIKSFRVLCLHRNV